MEWGLVRYVVRAGLGRTGTTWREVVGGRWRRPLDVLRNLGVALWVALSISAGFAEELVFRGYLFAQFRALTRSTAPSLTNRFNFEGHRAPGFAC